MIFRKIAERIGSDALVYELWNDESVFRQRSQATDDGFAGDTHFLAELDRGELAFVVLEQQRQQGFFLAIEVR